VRYNRRHKQKLRRLKAEMAEMDANKDKKKLEMTRKKVKKLKG
jgi:hypothetical protein